MLVVLVELVDIYRGGVGMAEQWELYDWCRETDARVSVRVRSRLLELAQSALARDAVSYWVRPDTGWPDWTLLSLSRQIGCLPSTLVSRFHRAGMGSKRVVQLLVGARVFSLIENPSVTLALAARHFGASSSQSFYRWMREVTEREGLPSSGKWRGVTGEAFLLLAVERLADPLARLRLGRPVGHGQVSVSVSETPPTQYQPSILQPDAASVEREAIRAAVRRLRLQAGVR